MPKKSSFGAPLRRGRLAGRFHHFAGTAALGFSGPQRDQLTRGLVLLMIAGVILLQRFALPIGDTPLSLSLVLGFGLFLGLVVTGRLAINTQRLGLFLFASATLLLTQLTGPGRFSPSSVGLLLLLYSIYVFRFRHGISLSGSVLRMFRGVMVICAAAGVSQFLLQFVAGAEVIFPIDRFVDESFLLPRFNVIIPLEYGSPIMKSNGVFFLEPSVFSQFMALAFLIESLYFRSMWRQALFLVGLFVAYSGTGLLLFGVSLPAIFLRPRGLRTLIVVALLAVVVVVGGEQLYIDTIARRVGEFQGTRTSGFARFISPFFLVDEFTFDTLPSSLFGLGAGSIDSVFDKVLYLAHDPSWVKVTFEYGVVGAAVFFAYFGHVLFYRSPDWRLSFVLLMQFLFLGGYLLSNYQHFVIAFLVAWHRPEPGLRSAAAREAAALAPRRARMSPGSG